MRSKALHHCVPVMHFEAERVRIIYIYLVTFSFFFLSTWYVILGKKIQGWEEIFRGKAHAPLLLVKGNSNPQTDPLTVE